jgi:hypothetical protein
MSKDKPITLSHREPEPEPAPEPVVEETVHEGETHTETTSTLVQPAQRVKDPAVNTTTRTYPPKPTDGQS